MESLDRRLVSTWSHNHSSVPLSYVQPLESRPSSKVTNLNSRKTIPVIDLGGHNDRAHTTKQILKASEDYGFFQIISNGRLVGAEHRVVTNLTMARTSVAYFIYPSMESIIEPAQCLMNETTLPVYKSMTFGEFRRKFFEKGPKIEEELQ
ncbi:uncharacterized protein LOC130735670 [Lotus japonicus]|uniref:uncharacterized protein LOC130735670 n=1 Tax=Lotus japonicus TaxID=34305 RepID=UPI002586E845|nr:uncharacterized protein LOC130735670 [Lotus japonicus]